MPLSIYSINQKFIKMKKVKNMDDLIKAIMLRQYVKLREKIDALLVSYLDGTYQREFVESLTNDPDKIDFIVIELSEYYHEFCNPDNDNDPAEHYINNIIRILNK